MIRLALAAVALLLPGAAEAKGFVALATRDAKPLVDWYTKAFELKVARSLRAKSGDMIVTILDGEHITVEIQQRADAVVPAERANRRVGIMKAGFQVAAIEPWLARWKAMGATILAGPFDDSAPRIRSVILLDPQGNSIHVMAKIGS